MAEMFGKQEGCCRGRGGSMHIFDRRRASMAATPSSAAGCRWPSASRLATRCRAANAVTACFFGDGAVDEGEFHESMNLPSLWKLPVLFVCENNLYAMGMALERAEAETDIARKAAGYRMPGEAVDGMDVVAVEGAARRCGRANPRRRRAAISRMPHLSLPRALDVRRAALSHQGRDRGLAQEGSDRPLQDWLMNNGLITRGRGAPHRGRGRRRDRRAVAFAEAGTLEPVEELERFVIMDEVPA